jgi:hypothetical protein
MRRHDPGTSASWPVRQAGAASSQDVVPGAIPVLAELGLSPTIARDRWSDLSAEDRRSLVRLRGYDTAELDPAPSTEHLWLPDRTGPAAYARLVRADGGEARVDHMCADEELRHLGLTSVLLADVVARHGAGPLVVHAPADVVPYLLRGGFTIVHDPGTGAPVPSEPGTTVLRRAPEAPWR